MNWYPAAAALFLALIHLFAEKLKFSYIPRSKWLSFAGGISVAYIFVHVLPELAEGQEMLKDKALAFLEHHAYLIALLGLLLFYGLEKAAKQSARSHKNASNNEMETGNADVFWIHIVSFALYNTIIGYLLVHREENSSTALLWFTLAMAFHFIVNDYGLLEHYHHVYRRKGRWILAFAILGGWLIGVLAELKELWITSLFAFIAGGIILNVLKEELPQEQKSNFWAFAAGLAAYSALLLFIE